MNEPVNSMSPAAMFEEFRATVRRIGQIDVAGGNGDGEKNRLGRRADELEAELQKRAAW